jgi:hypothetical protein
MNRIWALVALALIVATTLGCSQKNASSEAIAAAEQSLADVHELAMKYVPDRYAEVKADLDKARKAFEEQKFDEALSAAKTVPSRAKQLGEEAAAAREEAMAKLGETWTALSASIPGRLTEMEARLDELDKARRLPAGIEQDTVNKARSGLEWAKKEWGEATTSFAAGKLEEAVGAAQSVEYLLVTRMRALGLTPAEPVAPPAK